MNILRPTDDAIYKNRFRATRMKKIVSIIDEIASKKGGCHICDLGGRADYWIGLEDLWGSRPVHITLVDLIPTEAPDKRFTSVQGDACNMSFYSDNYFDLVHSNSVIEHVGTWQNKRSMAKEIRRLAPRYFVQTPNYWFPVEPHFRTLFLHWLPRPIQRQLVMRRDYAFHKRACSIDEADRILNDASLLDRQEMMDLFPDAEVDVESLFGLTKSLIAIR